MLDQLSEQRGDRTVWQDFLYVNRHLYIPITERNRAQCDQNGYKKPWILAWNIRILSSCLRMSSVRAVWQRFPARGRLWANSL